jgi:hypothetical protein
VGVVISSRRAETAGEDPRRKEITTEIAPCDETKTKIDDRRCRTRR